MKLIQRIIYFVAGLNLAWGTWDFVLHTFGDNLTGWRYAIVFVSCVELIFVLLVGEAKKGTVRRRWSLIPLALSAMIQAVKVAGDATNATSTAAGILMVVISVVSVAALAGVVYLFELREDAPTIAQQGQGGVFDPLQLSQALRDEWRADLALLALTQPAQPDGATETEAQPIQVVRAQPKQLEAATVQPGKIDKAQLAQLIEQGATAVEMAQAFGVSDAAIRKTTEWKSRKVQS